MNPQDLDPAHRAPAALPLRELEGRDRRARRGGALEVWIRPYPQASTLAEVRRMAGKPLQRSAPHARTSSSIASRSPTRASPRRPRRSSTTSASRVDLAKLTEQLPEVTDLLEAENDAPIIRLINALLTQAVREGASDVHLEIFESRALVRFRVDGALRDVVEPRRGLHPAMVSRIKVMATLDIAEKRLPQDGRITLRIAGRPIDVRVSTLPTAQRRARGAAPARQAGGPAHARRPRHGARPRATRSTRSSRQPHGILLVTGPTGSGKTTTLYAALSRLDRKTRNILTVEDPIEYELDGIGQTQVNPRIEMTFARALRAILRQDPDVVMIGEIRDLETAQIAVQASLTGHLVLATLHTNDAPGAVTRLVDMGIEPYLLASTLIGVLAQRLVRKLCPRCRAPYEPDAAERAVFGGARPSASTARSGCAACNFTGYKGPHRHLRAAHRRRRTCATSSTTPPPSASCASTAIARGMMRLRDDGLRWVRDGATSLTKCCASRALKRSPDPSPEGEAGNPDARLPLPGVQRRGQAPQGRARGRQRAPGARARCATRGSRPTASRSSPPTTRRGGRALPRDLALDRRAHPAHARPRLAARGRAHRRAGVQRADRAGGERARRARCSRRCAAR